MFEDTQKGQNQKVDNPGSRVQVLDVRLREHESSFPMKPQISRLWAKSVQSLVEDVRRNTAQALHNFYV